MYITIVICTHNRSALLSKAIRSICESAIYYNIKVNMIIVANACTDDTVTMVADLKNICADHVDIKLEIESKPGKSFALNKALSVIDDGFICFIDDDQTVEIGYISEIINAIKKYPESRAFCGRLHPDWTGEEPAWVHAKDKYQLYPLPFPEYDLGDVELTISRLNDALPSGGNCIIHKSLFEQLGLFSTELGPTGHNLVGSEDTDFFHRIIKSGNSIRYIPSIKQYHVVDLDRLKLRYLIYMCFQRNRSTVIASKTKNKPPLYLYKKAALYFLNTCLFTDIRRLRFYLMRLSSTFGEIVGYFNREKSL